MRDDKREVTMSTVIKNGTVLAADRTYEADLLIEGERISAIGDNLKGDIVLDAEGAYHARRYRSAYTPRNAVHGDDGRGDLGERHVCGSVRRHHHRGRLRHPRPGWDDDGAQGVAAACSPTGVIRLFISYVRHRMVAAAFRRDGAGCRPGYQHVQALHGLQRRFDGR